ncbi:unnamed protein product [Ixodes persulcatus]
MGRTPADRGSNAQGPRLFLRPRLCGTTSGRPLVMIGSCISRAAPLSPFLILTSQRQRKTNCPYKSPLATWRTGYYTESHFPGSQRDSLIEKRSPRSVCLGFAPSYKKSE